MLIHLPFFIAEISLQIIVRLLTWNGSGLVIWLWNTSFELNFKSAPIQDRLYFLDW